MSIGLTRRGPGDFIYEPKFISSQAVIRAEVQDGSRDHTTWLLKLANGEFVRHVTYSPEWDKELRALDGVSAGTGYHVAQIERGVFGEPSKIKEEFDEFMDARRQGVAIMELVELSDLMGAVEGYLGKYHKGTTLQDLLDMNRVTQRAFASGARKPK